ncbi:hypothetical protein [Microbulbifer taiwanensis]|uniref:Uncharacterized protein n=1 Tax=Microbulbifer taiwanensis TaxID=986746 RepID=A0ABW1YM42_9GAMM|nr:hypothetical protein [Microbulbifer taiwanensis]
MLCKPYSFWLAAAFWAAATGAAAAPIAAEQPDPRRQLLAEHRQLEDKLAAAVADSADAARAFGQLLPAGERRRLQAGCSTLTLNPDNTRARELLQEFFERYRDEKPRVIARYCFDPDLRQLQREVRATRRALQGRPASSGEFDFQYQRLERAAEAESRRYTAIRSILPTGQQAGGG